MTEQTPPARVVNPVLVGRGQVEGQGLLTDVQAILFDIDGTLVDSTGAVERTWAVWAQRHGLEVQDILRVCHGRRSEDTIADFLTGAEERVAAAAELEDLELHDMDDVVALPGALELLTGLPARRWAAVISGGRQLMQARLTAAGLPIPEVMVAAEDVEQGKPDPQGYLAAARTLGVSPAGCVVIEDAPAGVEAGRRAGAFTMAVCTSHPADQVAGADLVVPDLAEVAVRTSGDQLQLRWTSRPTNRPHPRGGVTARNSTRP